MKPTPYQQLYANPELNSTVCVATTGNENLFRTITLPDNITGQNPFLLLPAENGIYLAAGDELHFIDNNPNAKIISRNIIPNAPVLNHGDSVVFAFNGAAMFRTPGKLNEEKPYSLIPGNPDEDSILRQLIRFGEDFLSISLVPHSQARPHSLTIMATQGFAGQMVPTWTIDFPFPIPLSPVFANKEILIFPNSGWTAVDLKNGKCNIKSFNFRVLSGSSTNDGDLNLFIELNGGHYAQKCTITGEVLFRHPTGLSKVVCPPLGATSKSMYLLGPDKIEAYTERGLEWVYQRESGPEKPFWATLVEDRFIYVIDGTKLHCLASTGQRLWIFNNPNDRDFTTQPAIDRTGQIFITDGINIYIFK